MNSIKPFDVILLISIVYMLVDNYRIRIQFDRELENYKRDTLGLLSEMFYHNSNVLFEAEVLDFEEMEYSGSKDELIADTFSNIIQTASDKSD